MVKIFGRKHTVRIKFTSSRKRIIIEFNRRMAKEISWNI